MGDRRIDPLALFFAVVFVGLGALALVDIATDVDDVEPWLWSGALVVVGVGGLAASIGRSTGDDHSPEVSAEPTRDSSVDVEP